MSKHQKSKVKYSKKATRGHQLTGVHVATNPSDRTGQRDVGFVAIISLLAVVAVWILLMPWVPNIAYASMRRFHLGTSSFLVWAAQFPIPSMYNFSNRFEVDNYPPGLVDPLFDESEKRYLNHFPARCMTFADGRFNHFSKGNDRWITIDTSYRGLRLETRFHAKAKPDGGFELFRLSEPEGPR